MTRREFIRAVFAGVAGLGAAGLAGALSMRSSSRRSVWQIDPDVCVQCGNCSTQCVLTPSAVKAVHAYDVGGYCDLCSGYLQPGARKLDTSAESRRCPTGASRTLLQASVPHIPPIAPTIRPSADVQRSGQRAPS